MAIKLHFHSPVIEETGMAPFKEHTEEKAMISIRDEDYGLNVAVFNEFTLEDFNELENTIVDLIEKGGSANLLLDLTMMRAYTIDMALEQLKFLRAHGKRIDNVVVACDDVWIRFGGVISDLLTDTKTEYFKSSAEAIAALRQK